ncbi:hypothetical protein CRUP_008578 [Coryphaenoides rupestris]|nr:hypothetical protein CRUP_008578 [Coryphaenoides rupestris]
MSEGADEGEAVTLEMVNAVTLTRDSDGSLILHCPQTDEASEPVQKRIRLTVEEQEDPEETQFTVVTQPLSENDESFELTMTATADSELTEESVAQIQILQVDAEALSPQQKAGGDDVSPVSQAWFTTKEDKDTLANKGHTWKQGMWSKEEIDILVNNIARYVKNRGMEDPAEIIFEMSKEERKDFYRSVAWGLNRPLFAVYRRVLRMYDNSNHVGKYNHGEIEKLKSLRKKHGNDWATIGAALGRSASSVKDRCRLMKDTCNTGKWSEEEERRLAEVVYEMAGVSPGVAVTGGVSWASVAERVRSRSEKQCRSKWLNYLNWKHSGGTEWTKEDDLGLVRRIMEMQVEEENELRWEELAGGWSSVRSPQWLRSKWWNIKRQVSNHKDIPFSLLLEVLQDLMESSQANVGPGSPASSGQVRVTRLDESTGGGSGGDVGGANDDSVASLQIPGLPLGLGSNGTVTLTTSSSPSSPEHQIILHSLSTEGLCAGDGVIIQTVSSDPASSDPLGQSQLIVEAEAGQDPEVGLDAAGLLVLSASPVDETAALTTGGTVLIISPAISSTLTDPILENQEGLD